MRCAFCGLSDLFMATAFVMLCEDCGGTSCERCCNHDASKRRRP